MLLLCLLSCAGLVMSQKPSLTYCSTENNAGLYQSSKLDHGQEHMLGIWLTNLQHPTSS